MRSGKGGSMSRPAFSIEIRFLGGLNSRQQSVFERAAARWSEVIIGDLPNIRIDGEVIDDVVIDAKGSHIDGEGSILGQAGPTHLRPNSLLPARGIMEFDTADLARMEAEGSLQSVILHEMGHVIGIGTIWKQLGLIQGSNTANPVFTGANAMREFAALIEANEPTPVPVENRGGRGTAESHWRERVLGNELMTGFLSGSSQPFSRLTIAALQDLGYQVNFDAADPFTLPTALQLALMGVHAEGDHVMRCSMCTRRMRGTDPIVLSEDSLVNSQ